MLLFALALLFVTTAATWWRTRRAFPTLCVGLAVLLGELVLLQVGNAPFSLWNGRRLVSSVAWLRGHTIYGWNWETPIMAGLNGPTQVIAFSPAAIFGLPSTAIRFACLLAACFSFLPAFLVHRAALDRKISLFAFLGFGFLAFHSRSLSLSSFLVHADAPALGAATLACFAYLRRDRWRPLKSDVLAAVFAGLAPFAKITFLPVGLGLFVARWIQDGHRAAFRFAAIYLGAFAAILGVFVLIFGTGFLYDNVVVVKSMPWVTSLTVAATPVAQSTGDRIRILATALVELWRTNDLLFVSLGLFLFLALRKASWRRSAWVPVILVGLANLPTSLMGRAKGGSDLNTLSPSLYFFGLALTLLAGDWVASERRKRGAVAFAAICFLALGQLPKLHELTWPFGQTPLFEDEAFRYAKAHPGKVYFPEFPLPTLLSDNRIDQAYVSITELADTKHRLTDEQFRRYLPPQLDRVAVMNLDPRSVAQYLPEFSEPSRDASLPHFLLLTKGSRTPRSLSSPETGN